MPCNAIAPITVKDASSSLTDSGMCATKVEPGRTDDYTNENVSSYPYGGIYSGREDDTFTFIKCASYKDRPSHADNLHLDIWYKGQNLMRDAGTYKYYTDSNLMSYFTGSRSHCTVTLDDHDQMLKGQRFIWFNWTDSATANWVEEADRIIFSGRINAFQHLEKNIMHQREIQKIKGLPDWCITDEVNKNDGYVMRQWWHPSPEFLMNSPSRHLMKKAR